MTVAPASIASFDPGSREYLLDPHAFVQDWFEEAPVFFHEPLNAWFVNRYDDVRGIFDDSETYSNHTYKAIPLRPDLRERILPEWERAGQMVQSQQLNHLDPPEHTVKRRTMQQTFTIKHVEAVKPDIAAIADELIDGFIERGECDLMEEFATRLTLRVIGHMLGLPREMLPGFVDFIGDVAGLLAPLDMKPEDVTLSDDEIVTAYQRVHAAYVDYSRFLEERRANPGSDLTSAMLALADEDGSPTLTTDQVLTHMLGLVAAGDHTTALLIGNMVRLFTQQPDQLRLVLDDPRLWDNAVWEGLRRIAIITQLLRLSRSETEIAGVKIPAGSLLAPNIPAANADPAKFPDPLRFDVRRSNAGDALAFGHGRHYCLGAPLAPTEGRIAVETLYRRLPNLKADLDQELEFKPSLVMRMYPSQHVTW